MQRRNSLIAASLRASRRGLRRTIPAYLRGIFRRQAGYLLPSRETRVYETWIARHVAARRTVCQGALERGLLSILTPVWDGSPVRYLKTLANSIISQNEQGACEWIILDNGCSHRGILSFLEELKEHDWMKLHRVSANLGIIKGLRYCLERAPGRYALPVDADDYLYRDALRVITSWVQRAGYPALLYTDEDKIIGNRAYQPYLKPDWDPVLLLNSAYIAHLGVIDREKALELGAYTDPNVEGSPDWDVFVRFMIAGYTAVHIPEIVYSWRSHARSTADDAASKSYIQSSQKAVLQRDEKLSVGDCKLSRHGAHRALFPHPGEIAKIRRRAPTIRAAANSTEAEMTSGCGDHAVRIADWPANHRDFRTKLE